MNSWLINEQTPKQKEIQISESHCFNQTVKKDNNIWKSMNKMKTDISNNKSNLLLNHFENHLQKIKSLSHLQAELQANINIYLLFQKLGINILNIKSNIILKYLISQLILHQCNKDKQNQFKQTQTHSFFLKDGRQTINNAKKQKNNYKQQYQNIKKNQTDKQLIRSSTQKSSLLKSSKQTQKKKLLRHSVIPNSYNYKQTQIMIDLDYKNNSNNQFQQPIQKQNYTQNIEKCINCKKLSDCYNQMIETLQTYLMDKQQQFKEVWTSKNLISTQLDQNNRERQIIKAENLQLRQLLQQKQQELVILQKRVLNLQQQTYRLQQQIQYLNNYKSGVQKQIYRNKSLNLQYHRNNINFASINQYKRPFKNTSSDDQLMRCLFVQASSIQQFLN